jgi:hypothetical protein
MFLLEIKQMTRYNGFGKYVNSYLITTVARVEYRDDGAKLSKPP